MAVKKTNRKPATTAGKKNANPKTKATSRRTTPAPTPAKAQKGRFDDISSVRFTKNKIVVEQEETKTTARTHEKVVKTKYYDNTPENIQELNKAINKKGIKKMIF